MPIRKVAPLSTPESIAVLDDLRRIVRALRESSREAERVLGVSGAQLFVLRCLAEAGSEAGAEAGALSLNALAARTRTHQSTVSVVVKRLVAGGLVAREVSRVDARRVELSLTKRGRALLERAPLAAQDKLIRGVERLPHKERRALSASLRGLVSAMQLSDEPAPMFFEDDEPVAERRSRRGSP